MLRGRALTPDEIRLSYAIAREVCTLERIPNQIGQVARYVQQRERLRVAGVSLADDTRLEVARLRLLQERRCPLCGADLALSARTIIRDLATGTARHLICDDCNSLAGDAPDGSPVLSSALRFLAGPHRVRINAAVAEVFGLDLADG